MKKIIERVIQEEVCYCDVCRSKKTTGKCFVCERDLCDSHLTTVLGDRLDYITLCKECKAPYFAIQNEMDEKENKIIIETENKIKILKKIRKENLK